MLVLALPGGRPGRAGRGGRQPALSASLVDLRLQLLAGPGFHA